MKNILIVFAHPEPKSMNGQLKDKAVKVLTESGHQVSVSDLYASDFPIVRKEDFTFFESDFFDLQYVQSKAH